MCQPAGLKFPEKRNPRSKTETSAYLTAA